MSEKFMKLHASYMREAFGDMDEMLANAEYALEGVDYDTMIGTGLSGALSVPFLARALGKSWAIVRKPGDGTHSDTMIEGIVGTRWIFVDDFVASGDTLRRVKEEVVRALYSHTTYVGQYEWHGAARYTPYKPRPYPDVHGIWRNPDNGQFAPKPRMYDFTF